MKYAIPDQQYLKRHGVMRAKIHTASIPFLALSGINSADIKNALKNKKNKTNYNHPVFSP